MNEEVKNEEIEATAVEDATAESTTEEETSGEPDNGLAKGDGPDFKWYIVSALSQYEGRVSKTLKERILNLKMTEFFADIVVPEEMVTTNVNGKRRNIKKKFFPGYVLIRMILNKDTWHLVKNTDKITGFVGGTSDNPLPISDEEAAGMMGTSKDSGKKSRSTATYSTGDSVKVVEGPFASFVGTVESVNANGKLKVNVSIFGRPTPVELDDSQVEKA